MKPLPTGETPYTEAGVVLGGAVLLLALYSGIEPYLPGSALFHPFDMMGTSVWLAWQVVRLVQAITRYYQWHQSSVWEMEI